MQADTQPRAPRPDEVPYLNQGISFRDRENELLLKIQLLDSERARAAQELQYVRQCNHAREYPGVVIEPESKEPQDA